MKKLLTVFIVLLVLAFSVYAGGTKEKSTATTAPAATTSTTTTPTAAAIKNPNSFVEATIGDVATWDPAVAYDNASWTALRATYDTLIQYDGSSVDKFTPLIATDVPSTSNGGISADGKTVTFHIRQGITFHNGDPLTAEDVAYTFKRDMVTDPDAGPDWIWFNLFMGSDVSGSRDGNGNIAVKYADIDNAVTVSDPYTVVFHLHDPNPAFLSIVAGQWGAIVDKKFVAANGGWDGTQATWKQFNNPATGKETLYQLENGSGPFKLTRWDKGQDFVVDRYDGYWGKKPALAEAIYKVVNEWSTRKLMLLQGDADYAWVPPQNYNEMANEQGIRVEAQLPSIQVDGINFNLNINTKDNPGTYSGQLDGNGVPSNFFADKNVRLGFVHAWDEQTYLQQGLGGHATDPVTPITKGLPYKDNSLENFNYDPNLATQYLKQAFGGQLWQKGFKIDFLFNTGNSSREVGLKMLAENLMKLNPKFQINVRGVEWPVYLAANRNKTNPIFFIGWAPDYPDPADYVFPYMDSQGTYAGRAGYNNPVADKLIAEASVSLDPAVRQRDYYQLQKIWLDDAIGIMTSQPLTNRYYKDWVKGTYYNVMQSDPFDLIRDITKG